jgi:uncharacterized membrane protein
VSQNKANPVSLRIELIDALRGVALLGMFVFHFTWDLGYFRFIPPEFPFSPEFMMFGHVVASTFLALVGASLARASRQGMRWRNFWKRIGMIGLAAAGITAVTYYLFPDSFIFFGILHCILVASVVAALLLRAPLWLVFVMAAAIFATPLLYESAFFDAPAFWWTGLGLSEPRSNDWRPFFPWVGFSLAGLAVMRVLLDRGVAQWLASWRTRNLAARTLTWGGRHSLLIYLVHQPVFFALVYAATLFPNAPEEAAYRRSCETQCLSAGAEAPFCARACGCVTAEFKKAGIWRNVLHNTLSADENEKFVALSQQCARE